MLKGLYFPGLRPDQAWREALLPLVERLVVYGVVESESALGAIPLPWDLKVVAPLGDDAGRFHALLREMTGRDAAVIRGQLLSMASRPGRDRDEDNAWSLSSAMQRIGGDGAGVEIAKARGERLWQARLFLKLAEAVTSAEAEISLGLAQMAEKQAAMLQALQGGDDEDEPDGAIPVTPLPYRPPGRFFRVRDQLAAWAVFYLQDSGPEPLLLTDDPEAANLLVDEMEKRAPGEVIPLPALDWDLGESDRAAVLNALQTLLSGQVEAGRTALLALAESQKNSRSASGGVPMRMRLYLFPGREFRRVMAQLSGLPGEESATAQASPFVLVGAIAPGEAY